MIKKVLLVFITLMFSSMTYASWFSSEQRQMTAPKSVQQRLIDKKSVRCDQKLEEYHQLVEENSDSDYYRYLLENWKRDCQ